jgi:FtsP/CotA-like multicopper oxidase with cupredoxin domain
VTSIDQGRRAVLRGVVLGGLGIVSGVPRAATSPTTLRAAQATLPLLGAPHPATRVWAYNGNVPGPTLRVRQGERFDAELVNALDEATTIHWHGVRVPNAMDGVPHVTQPPVAPGERFRYTFTCSDAGTFWYHPHASANIQVDMGLAGVLIVEEPAPPPVDRDETWVLDDWRMQRDGQIVRDFDSRFDATHAGRVGNSVTINGRLPDRFDVRTHERIRLRLVNVANARVFSLQFEGHAPVILAHDGMPCAPYPLPRDRVVIGPGMRVDLLLDASAEPGSSFRVLDDFFPRSTYELVKLSYGPTRLRSKPLADRIVLAPNPLPRLDLAAPIRHRMVLSGGMMAAPTGTGRAWAIDGKSSDETHHGHAPLLRLARDRSCVLEIVNDTAWWHPMHLHGHVFRIMSRNGEPAPREIHADTMLLPPRERAEIAFVADNPGDWMLHCHVLEHQASGMMGLVRVD